MSTIFFKAESSDKQSISLRSSKIENEIMDKETLGKTNFKSTPMHFHEAEDEIVALILSSIMGSIIQSWQYLDEDTISLSCKIAESVISNPEESSTSLIYKKSIVSELSYWAMGDDRKRHSLHKQQASVHSIADILSSCAQLENILKSLFDDIKGKIFGWQFIEEEPQVQIIFKQGNRFEGKLSQCRMHGPGKFFWADGSVYEKPSNTENESDSDSRNEMDSVQVSKEIT